ncbi:MAG: competence/damage-inducible protein A [Chloroflexi bacterium]|nr:competence/damage-inducible protein A [Chloroflexota bacterium]MBA3739700.1 competence/damage-inducible protein A [Chloroflexota bacterium]
MTNAELLSIGAELLLGETVDTNAAFLGRETAAIGLPLRHARMLPDDRGVIRDAFNDARARSTVILATGGLGPTHDDLSREGLADALGEALRPDPGLMATIEERFATLGPMPAANRRQAMLIPSAQALPNPIGSAPGWWVETDGVVMALMPGVPSEMRRMWTDEVRPRLEARFALPPLAMRTVKAFGMGESGMAELLGRLITKPPAGVEAGIYARDDGVHVRFSTHDHPSALDSLVAEALATLGEAVYGTDDDDLATVALSRLGAMGISELSSWEADTEGALLAILAAAAVQEGSARYIGGVLDMGTPSGPPVGDAVLQLSLLPQDAHGRSRVRLALSGAVAMPMTELRIHGTGPQRLRRAAFAALDAVRKFSSSGR